MERRIDPEPFTVIAAVAGVTSAIFQAVTLFRRAFEEAPHKTRQRAIGIANEIEDLVKYLRTDLGIIEDIYRGVPIVGDWKLRIGSGALLSDRDFERYRQTSDQVFGRLRALYKLALKLEKLAARISEDHRRDVSRDLARAREKLEGLFNFGDLGVEDAWETLRSLLTDVEEMAANIRE